MTENKEDFSMQRGRIVEPGSPDWFRTVSFGDILKMVAFIFAGFLAFNHLITRVDHVEGELAHEAELRHMLDGSTRDLVEAIRNAQKDNTARWDQRFADTQQRDRELMTEVKTRMDRIEGKIDTIQSNRTLDMGGPRTR